MANDHKGLFVVLEGIDGSGTSTQVRALWQLFSQEHKRGRSLEPVMTHEPTDRPIGKMLREIMRGSIPGNGRGAWRPPPQAMALLFTADRLDHVESLIRPKCEEGCVVFCDRYVHSTLGYQALTAIGDTELISIEFVEEFRWLLVASRHIILPDLTIVLDVSPETAAKRRAQRDGVPEMYEQDELQKRLAEYYHHLPEVAIAGGLPGRIEVVSGELEWDLVLARCTDLVEPLIHEKVANNRKA